MASGVERPFLLLLVDDLMVASRIETTATHLGYGVRYARTPADLWAHLADRPALVLLATHASRLPWRDLLPGLRARPDAPPVLAFGPHADAATRAQARQAGATRWVANSRVAEALPDVIQQLARRD